MNKKLITFVALLIILFVAVPAFAGPDKAEKSSYIVVMLDDPAVSYDGHIAGLTATRPGKGQKINPNSAHVKKYTKFLEDKHDKALKGAGLQVDDKVHDYTFALNGFSTIMTEAQAAEMAKQDGVTLVLKDQMRYPQTDNSPSFLGLTADGGAYAKGYNGEGVVVGILDTGIWPEHPSFADDGSFASPPTGSLPCDFGNTAWNPNDAPFTCNNKLIGALQVMDTYRFFFGPDPGGYESARDDDGHGTHTASTAAGNAGVAASIFGIPRGTVSGIAPRAHVMAYKVCGEVGCFGSDSADAIDHAIADGVDVINYSIGGGAGPPGIDEIAFLFADFGGLFVATSAGNSGPGAATVGNPAAMPWITAVGASMQSRAFISDITLSGPGTPPTGLWGGSVTTGIENYNLVDADSVAGGTNGECLNAFPAGTFQANDAVLCNRYIFGVARTQRVANVAAGGGGAVIFHNVSSTHPNMTPTDNHPLPTVHMLNDVGQPLKDYLVANPGQVTVSFTQSVSRYAGEDPRVVPNVMASFSSRGPNLAAGDIIKPDVTAPGINILAGASPIHLGTAAQGELFQSIMGTSMSSPHVAGIFALLKQAHPDWSPAMARSALMTTAYQDVLKHDYATPADPFDVGAGHVNPGGEWSKGSITEPGLAYDAGLFEYAAFTCGMDWGVFSQGSCDFLESIGVPSDPSDLNYPSIGVADLAGSQTVVRTVTSVAKEYGWRTYSASVDAPPGYTVSVSPSTFTLKRGDTATYHVTITNDGSGPIGEWRFGSLTWHEKDGNYSVYSPIAVRGALFDAPTQVSDSGTSGSASFDVSFGYTGAYTAAPHGLIPATVTSDNVLQDPDQSFSTGDVASGGANLHQFALSGAAHFRIAMPPEATEAGADLDIFVYNPAGNRVASSTSGGTDELIDIPLPEDGTWSVYVHGWASPGGDSDYNMWTWEVPLASGGSLSVDAAPTAAVIATTGTVDISWSGLTSGSIGDWYLGAVSHTGDVGLIGLTLVDIDNRQ